MSSTKDQGLREDPSLLPSSQSDNDCHAQIKGWPRTKNKKQSCFLSFNSTSKAQRKVKLDFSGQAHFQVSLEFRKVLYTLRNTAKTKTFPLAVTVDKLEEAKETSGTKIISFS